MKLIYSLYKIFVVIIIFFNIKNNYQTEVNQHYRFKQLFIKTAKNRLNFSYTFRDCTKFLQN